MSAGKPNKAVSEDASTEAETQLHVTLLQTLSKEDILYLEERMLYPRKETEKERHEEAARQMADFITSIPEIRAGFRLPAGFARMWNLLIEIFEQETKQQFIESDSNPKHLHSLIKRGWITVDPEAIKLRCHAIEPPSKVRPIPVVLINNEGHWTAPTVLTQIVKNHPFVRAVSSKQPALTIEQQIARTIKRAEMGLKGGGYHGSILA